MFLFGWHLYEKIGVELAVYAAIGILYYLDRRRARKVSAKDITGTSTRK